MSKGTVKIKNLEGYFDWVRTLKEDNAELLKEQLKDAIFKHYPEKKQSARRELAEFKLIDELCETYGGYCRYPGAENRRYSWEEHLSLYMDKCRDFFSYAEKFNQEVQVADWFEEYAIFFIGNQAAALMVVNPQSYFEYTPAQNYDDLTPAEVKQQLLSSGKEGNTTNIVSAESGMAVSHNTVETQLSDTQNRIAALESEMEDVKRAKCGELAEMQAKIEAMKADLEAKKEKMLLALAEQMKAMNEAKEKLEMQIYMLDSQIFAIRCYAGETINFTAIRTGRPAPETEPVVIHQKLRFLDEELGKLASLYTIQWDELHLFEEFLQHSPLAFETFVPNNRCIVLIRLSRTGKIMGLDDGRSGYRNLLKKYDYYHGETVGILIRNGENLYLGWADDEHIKIKDDFVNNVIDLSDDTPRRPFYSEWDKEEYKARQKAKKKAAMKEVLSRVFVTNILQGIVDNSDILPMPEGVRFDKPSPYIQYSLADAWLDDGRFGDFTQIIQKCNETVKAGDTILTLLYLVPEHYADFGRRAFIDEVGVNFRGRGWANRTHDCRVSDCTLYPVNLVEYDDPIDYVVYEEKSQRPDLNEQVWEKRKDRDYQFDRMMKNDSEFAGNIRNVERVTEPGERHVFVSIAKEENWRRCGEPYLREPRSNFEVYTEEFINLTYMNSVWLTWAITQKKLGGWRVGGQSMDYASAIAYLNKALEYVRRREETEKELIDAIDPSVCQDAEWPLKLTEWKMEKGVRTITAYQAQRFVKAVHADK